MKKTLFILMALLVLLAACTKNFLDKKPDQSLVVPQTLQDLQALLDNAGVMNTHMPALGQISSDDCFVTDAGFASVSVPTYRNAYTWNRDIYEGTPDVVDWNYPYQQIFYSDVVLEGLAKMKPAQQATAQYAAEKGSALFFRGLGLFSVAQLFCKPYTTANAATDPGVPVRISSDINQKSLRGTVAKTYSQIIADLQQSLNYLPAQVSLKTRPDIAAGNGLLARVYLAMGDYPNAFKYADAALKLYGTLTDYNTTNQAKQFPFSRYNDEVIFHSLMYGNSFSNTSRILIDTGLYRSYLPGDLRQVLFFVPKGTGNTYRGSYSGNSDLFNGVATDELYLIRAEAAARQNNKEAALNDLNTLLVTRYKSGTFMPLTAANAGEALDQVLAERRKELLFRGLRWTDLRRLNMEPVRSVTLERKLNGKVYTLPPNDARYLMPIPDIVVQLGGLPQNAR